MSAIIIGMVFAVLLIFSNVAQAKNYTTQLCRHEQQYNCYIAKRGDTWEKLFPNENERDVIKKVNRTNLKLEPGMKIAIPKTIHVDANPLDYAPFAKQIDPPGRKVIYVSLTKLAFGAYDSQGALQYWGPVSGGQGYCPDVNRRCRTATGTFEIYQKGGAGCKSTRYPVGRGGAPMPYCMFFNGNFALHGSPTVPGYNASHGCVRLFTNDAKWLNQEFTADEDVKVVVNSD